MKLFLKTLVTFHLCVLIVLLPGCSLFMPWLAGENADIYLIEKELDDIKAGIRAADTNADGKLGMKEGLIYAAGAALFGGAGANAYRNRARRQRGERVDTHPNAPIAT